jgi:hypothetical protein
MPRRRQKQLRQKQISASAIEQLRELVNSGVIWTKGGLPHGPRGTPEARGLASGIFFSFSLHFCDSEDDRETQEFLWRELQPDILREHIRYSPLTRPWGWWQFEAPEERRLLKIGTNYSVGILNGEDIRAPLEDPEDGEEIYETDFQYLTRLNLLTREEKSIVKKYGSVRRVSVSQGEFGKCRSCWEKAYEIAAKIGFDLKAALGASKFWIPEALFFDCLHFELWGPGGRYIFHPEYNRHGV